MPPLLDMVRCPLANAFFMASVRVTTSNQKHAASYYNTNARPYLPNVGKAQPVIIFHTTHSLLLSIVERSVAALAAIVQKRRGVTVYLDGE